MAPCTGDLPTTAEAVDGGHRPEGDLVRSALRTTPLFARVPDEVLEDIRDELTPLVVPGGQVLFSRGDVGDSLYVLVSGRLQVLDGDGAAPPGQRSVPMAELGPGDVVGEVALLTEQPRSATVRAVRDSILLQLTREGFDRFVEHHPEALVMVARGLARRLPGGRRAEVSGVPPRTIAVVPASGDPVVTEVCEQLAAALGRHGRVARISARVVDEHLGPGAAEGEMGPGADGVAAWLHDREDDHDVVLYEGDVTPTAWTTRCLRQADRVLVVADARRPPAAATHEARGTVARVDLVLVHGAGASRPTGTAAWLAAVPAQAHHHVRRGRREDFERLARLLAGRAVGLVLGGGGPRGFAHLGVMQALEEAGVPIDAIGGSSIGAIMGATHAVGLDHAGRREAAVSAFVETRFLFGLTLPVVSLSSSRKLTRMLASPTYFGDTRIEDLWRPFFCVSTNLSTADVVVHDRDTLWWALRASIALPGVLPPVWSGGDVLVDGGVLNNLPVDVMHARIDGGRVVAVDLQPEIEFRALDEFSPTVSGWSALRRKLPTRGARAMPGIAAVLMRTREVGWARTRAELLRSGTVDLLLRPPLGPTRVIDFSVGPALIDAAYRHTLERLDDATVASLRG